MKLLFFTKNIDISPSIKAEFENKLNVLKKYQNTVKILNIRVDLSRDKHHRKGGVYRVEVNIDIPGAVLRSMETGSNIISALDAVSEKLERQMRDYKDKTISQLKHGK